MWLIIVSHICNLIITASVSLLLFIKPTSMDDVYGPDTPARRILACIYAAIALISLYALILFFGFGNKEGCAALAVVVFPLQIIYKTLTLLTVGLANPVVKTNIIIVILLSVSLLSLVLK